MPIASLRGLDRNFRVLYTGTFSKVLFPSLRLGYLVLPPDLIDTFQEVRMAMDMFSPAFYQEVLADFIREGHFTRHIRRMRSLYAERRMTLIECLRQELGFTGEVSGAHAGTYLVLTLNGISERAIAERAADRGLWLLPLSPFYASTPSRQGLVLGYGSTPVEEIPKAVRKLREVRAGSVPDTRMNHPKTPSMRRPVGVKWFFSFFRWTRFFSLPGYYCRHPSIRTLGLPRHFLSPKFWLIGTKSEFFNGHACFRQLTVLVPAGRARSPRCYCNLAYSALASFRRGISGSASLQSVRKSL